MLCSTWKRIGRVRLYTRGLLNACMTRLWPTRDSLMITMSASICIRTIQIPLKSLHSWLRTILS